MAEAKLGESRPAGEPIQIRFCERAFRVVHDLLTASQRLKPRLDAVTIRFEGESMETLSNVVQLLRNERERTRKELNRLEAALAALEIPVANGRRGPLSAAGRKAISVAQKARWAKKSSNGHAEAASPRRKMSAASRKKIAAAQQERWAAWRAKHKKTA